MREIGDEDGLFVDGYSESTSLPSALSRWSQESQILDPDSVHYCISALKPDLFPVFEKRLSEEVAKEKVEEQKKKKEAEAKAAAKKKEEEEEAKKKAESEPANPSAANQQPTEEMQVDLASVSREADISTDESPNSSVLVSMSMDHGIEIENQTSTPREPPTSSSEEPQNNPSSASLAEETNASMPSASGSSLTVDNQIDQPSEAMGSPPVGSPMTLGSEASVASAESGVQGGEGNEGDETAKDGKFRACLLSFCLILWCFAFASFIYF